MALVAYRLRPGGALHIGTGREGDMADVEGLPRSDTLAAAIVSMWRHVVPGSTSSEITSVAAERRFAVSSALPTVKVANRWEPLLFVPPWLFDQAVAKDPSQRKFYKKIRFAPAEAIRNFLIGSPPRGFRGVGNALVPDGFAQQALWQSESRPRLEVNRLNGGPIVGRLFDFGAIRFTADVHLTLVAEFFEASAQSRLEAALRLLGDHGIGGDRSVGYGGFEVVAAEPFRPAELGNGARLTLSLLHPAAEEIQAGLLDPPANYLIVRRGGWVTAPGAESLRRRAVNLLAEGSIVRDLSRGSYGDSPMVLSSAPGLGLHHPVYRAGRAVTIPISTSGEKQ